MKKNNVQDSKLTTQETALNQKQNNKVAIYLPAVAGVRYDTCLDIAFELGFTGNQIQLFTETDFSDKEKELSTVLSSLLIRAENGEFKIIIGYSSDIFSKHRIKTEIILELLDSYNVPIVLADKPDIDIDKIKKTIGMEGEYNQSNNMAIGEVAIYASSSYFSDLNNQIKLGIKAAYELGYHPDNIHIYQDLYPALSNSKLSKGLDKLRHDVTKGCIQTIISHNIISIGLGRGLDISLDVCKAFRIRNVSLYFTDECYVRSFCFLPLLELVDAYAKYDISIFKDGGLNYTIG